jgi:hypothetical protein
MLQRGYDPLHIESAVNTKAHNWLLLNQPINKVTVPDVTTNFKVYTLNWNDHELETFVGDDDDPFRTRILFWPKLEGNWTRWYFSFSNKFFSIFSFRPFDKPFYVLFYVVVGGKWCVDFFQ